jgi:hypothetical protein
VHLRNRAKSVNTTKINIETSSNNIEQYHVNSVVSGEKIPGVTMPIISRLRLDEILKNADLDVIKEKQRILGKTHIRRQSSGSGYLLGRGRKVMLGEGFVVGVGEREDARKIDFSLTRKSWVDCNPYNNYGRDK